MKTIYIPFSPVTISEHVQLAFRMLNDRSMTVREIEIEFSWKIISIEMLPTTSEALSRYNGLAKKAGALIITNDRKFSNYYKNLLL
jgi:hypothetical protein